MDLVFSCLKCGHLLFISGTSVQKVKKIKTLDNCSCPNCGTEREENWVYVRTGDYDKEVLKDEYKN